jgi:hypothetical protein
MMSDNCEECGRDLYSEPNILLELKATTDKLLDGVDAKTIGRPMFVVVMGDNGAGAVRSPNFHVPDEETNEIFVTCLTEVLRMYKRKRWK